MVVMPIKYHECEEWLLKIHYAKRLPSITHSYGLYEDNKLEGIVTYGSPPSPSLCIGICGAEYKDRVLELKDRGSNFSVHGNGMSGLGRRCAAMKPPG